MAETEGAVPRVERPRSEFKRTVAAYRETFRRHQRLLSLPIILAVFIAGWSVLGSPKSYQSTADLWVDNPVSIASSLGNANPTVVPPAQQEQSLIAELLATRDFRLAVGHQSQLGRYLAHNSTDGWGPSGLLSAIGGSGSTSDRILGALGPSQVLTTVTGPQVLQVSYRGPTPAVATSTLRALINQLQSQSSRFASVHTQDSIAYYSAQVQAASKQLSVARQQVAAYLKDHPGATTTTDQTLSALTAAQTIASSTLTRATTTLNGASGSGQDPGGTSGSLVQEIDQPTVPAGAVSGHKKELVAIFGGLFAGALITLLGLVALTPGRRDTWGEELGGEDSDRPAARPQPVDPLPPVPATVRAPNGRPTNGASTHRRADEGALAAVAADGNRRADEGALAAPPANGNRRADEDALAASATNGRREAEKDALAAVASHGNGTADEDALAAVASHGNRTAEEDALAAVASHGNGTAEEDALAAVASNGNGTADEGALPAVAAEETGTADGALTAVAADENGTADAAQSNGDGHAEPTSEPDPSDSPRSKHAALAHARAAGRPARLEEFIDVVRKHPGITIPDAARRMDVHRDSLYRVRDRAQRAGKIRADGSRYFPTEHRRESNDGQS